MGAAERREANGSRVVSFRIDASHAARLDQAAQRLRTSPGDVARKVLLAYLEGSEQAALQRVADQVQGAQRKSEVATRDMIKAVEKVQRELAANQRRLSASVQMLLVNGGKLNPEQARKFARENLLGTSEDDDEP